MTLDFRSIQALASRSRIRILKELLQDGCTPTDLANRMETDTSQIVMELETLSNADLVEQHTPDDDFNTVYRPTQKAEKLVANSNAKVSVSIGSSIIAGITGIAALSPGSGFFDSSLRDIDAASMSQSTRESVSSSDPAGLMSFLDILDEPVGLVGVLLLLSAAFLVTYAWTVHSLSSY